MAYVALADFRTATLTSYCIGCDMTTGDISDANLPALITEVSDAFDRYTGDHFEPPSPDNDTTLIVSGEGQCRLFVPKRIRSITSIAVTVPGGSSSTIASSYYWYEQFTGSFDQVPHGSFVEGYSYRWPVGTENVTLTGKFDWAACPAQVKRAIALGCWERVNVDGSTVITEGALSGGFSRMVEAQNIADRFRRMVYA